ncbi:MAG: DUF429 domain-containing protein, partial [Phycisphaerales bacterium]
PWEGRIAAVVFGALRGRVEGCAGVERALVDVPIGLVDGVRACDVEARRLMGRHGSRVFAAPARSVIGAKDWAEANALSRRVAGRGLSKQAWAITARIRETDLCMRCSAAARRVVRECHPEVCFWAMNGRRAVGENKKTEEGYEARIRLLEARVPGARGLVEEGMRRWRRSVMARDDLVDALAAAVTACAPAECLRTLPAAPARDEHGLAMEMVYAGESV